MNNPHNEFAGALILVIEDEPTQRLITRDCLEEAGFRVEEEGNGEIGLDRARALRPDLVLLDVMLPGIDGFEVCRKIRQDETIAHTPVVLITGRDNINDVRQGFSMGANDFFSKPVRWNLLPTRIEFVLRATRLEQELRRSKEAAERANLAKSSLLSTMGHELRTPLNAIIGFSELIKQQTYGPVGVPEYEEFIGDINSAGTLLLNGINDVLEIVNSESEELAPDLPASKLSDMLKQAISDTSSIAREKNIHWACDVPPEPILIQGDRTRLVHAISNLLSNAAKFSRHDGTVSIKAEVSPGSGLLLSITDEGIGIDPTDLQRIMEPFEQVDGSLSRVYEGMGLGLPLARAAVHLHAGELTLSSTPGKGTKATIVLPESRFDLEPPTSPDTSLDRASG